ncbi:hypothetical protein [Streptomyces spirodelae]|uniref:ImmA/IrrE family metallo-endopeptidase n=1 Tax=Streptomyces spirodelae TaxID=2812904 RepID=A0ABS3WM78_9ACTN|nr:hypothetical protein [Streptomyces spirodelae]MBO8184226.1 hypothetical protein [Streptomyces spirodelae]
MKRLLRRGPVGPGENSGGVAHRAVIRESKKIVRSMPIPRPFQMDAFIERIEAERCRRVKLVPLPDRLLGRTGLSGLWLWHEELPLDLILHSAERPVGHRQRIILHELAHMWCNDDKGSEAQQLETLLPDFPPELLRRLTGGTGRVMTRHRYSTPTEARAETIAGLLHYEAYGVEPIEDTTLRQLNESLSSLHSHRSGLA